MESGALATAEFREFAKDVVLFCHITTRVPDDPYQGLLKAVGGKGFPTVLFMDGMGKVVGNVDFYRGLTVARFQAVKAQVEKRLKLLDKEKLSDEEKVDLFLLDADLALLDFGTAKKRVEALGKLLGETAAKVTAVVTNLEVEDHLTPRPRGADAVNEVGEAFYEMAKAGRVPTSPGLVSGFWSYMFAWAESTKNLEAARFIVAGVKKGAESDPRMASLLKAVEARLKKLEGE